MKRVGLFGVWAGFLCFIAAAIFLFPAKAETQLSHWGGSITVEPSRNLSAQEVLYPPDCTLRPTPVVKLHNYANNLSLTETLKDTYLHDVGETCHLSNNQGTFAMIYANSWSNVERHEARYYQPGAGVNGFLEWFVSTGTTRWYEPAPSGNNVLYLSRPDGYTNYYSIALEKNLRSWGKVWPHQFALKWGAGDLETRQQIQFRYADNTRVQTQKHFFSRNGRYLVIADIQSVGLIDLATSTYTHVLGNQRDRRLLFAVSNDGRYISVGYRNRIEVIEVSACEKIYTDGSWQKPENASDLHPGCRRVKDFSSELADAGTTIDDQLRRMYFSQSGDSLFFSVGKNARNGATGDHIWQEYEFHAEDFVPSANGYLAMGDSYSSGEGETEGREWYEPGTDEQGDKDTFAGRNLCHLSRRGYPYLLALELGYLETNQASPPEDGLFHSVACSGAKIHNVIGTIGEKHDNGGAEYFASTDNQYRYDRDSPIASWQPGATKQIGALSGWNTPIGTLRTKFDPGVITLGIGGNDAGFGDFLKACVLSGTCEFAQPGSDKATRLAVQIAGNKSRLSRAYEQVKEEAPEARVYVHGYPVFVRGEGGSCGLNVRLDDQERRFAGQATRYMNDVVEAAATEAGVYYVDVEDIFDGGRLCDEGEKFVNGVTGGDDSGPFADSRFVRAVFGNESFHPNAKGFEKYEQAILSKTSGLSVGLPAPKSDVPIPVPAAEIFGSPASQKVTTMNAPPTQTQDSKQFRQEVLAGALEASGGANLRATGLFPGSEADIFVHSDPIKLGTFAADSSGTLNVEVLLPNLEPGYHELHVVGFDSYGQPVDIYESFVVGVSENDFDGDGIENTADSCPAIPNAHVDQDQDGIDDACDAVVESSLPNPSANDSDDVINLQPPTEAAELSPSNNTGLVSAGSGSFTLTGVAQNSTTQTSQLKSINSGNTGKVLDAKQRAAAPISKNQEDFAVKWGWIAGAVGAGLVIGLIALTKRKMS